MNAELMHMNGDQTALQEAELDRMVEAILFAVAEPVTAGEIRDRIGEDCDVQASLRRLCVQYARQGSPGCSRRRRMGVSDSARSRLSDDARKICSKKAVESRVGNARHHRLPSARDAQRKLKKFAASRFRRDHWIN